MDWLLVVVALIEAIQVIDHFVGRSGEVEKMVSPGDRPLFTRAANWYGLRAGSAACSTERLRLQK
jgi:hypothetical protein